MGFTKTLSISKHVLSNDRRTGKGRIRKDVEANVCGPVELLSRNSLAGLMKVGNYLNQDGRYSQ
jgi:hypothetical protein